jgi:protein-disulfide isomerase-like protein with CxxC motif
MHGRKTKCIIEGQGRARELMKKAGVKGIPFLQANEENTTSSIKSEESIPEPTTVVRKLTGCR